MTEERLFSIEREQEILDKLAGPIGDLIVRHERATSDWDPYDYIPRHIATRFGYDQPWSTEDYPLPTAFRSGLYVNLATEDNLPKYYEEINKHAPEKHPLKDWVGIWTYEESRHSDVIAGWARATRALSPKQIMVERKEQMTKGESPQAQTALELFAYASLQEKATAVSHDGVIGALDPDKWGDRVMKRVAKDENLHFGFYSAAAAAAFRVAPNEMMQALDNQLRHFNMPGKTGIPDYEARAAEIAAAGIYNWTKFRDNVTEVALRTWKIDDVDGLNAAGEAARERIHRFVTKVLDRAVAREKAAFA